MPAPASMFANIRMPFMNRTVTGSGRSCSLGPWLLYLPLFFLPWIWAPPSATAVATSAVGLTFFWILYVSGMGRAGAQLIVAATGVLGVSFALASTGGVWPVIAVYAAAMAARVRPVVQARLCVFFFAVCTAAYAILFDELSPLTMAGVVTIIIVGIDTISRSMLHETNENLKNAREEVRHLSAVAERERIGRDLHDLLGRTLTVVALKSDLATKLLLKDPAQARCEMKEVAGAAREALAEVRAAVSGMVDITLVREIASSRAALTAAGISCVISGDANSISAGAGSVLSMTLREAVTNVIRHSGANSCRISARSVGGFVTLTIADDGVGSHRREGSGIRGMRNRLTAAGGLFEMANDFQGTRVVAAVPAVVK